MLSLSVVHHLKRSVLKLAMIIELAKRSSFILEKRKSRLEQKLWGPIEACKKVFFVIDTNFSY